MSDVTLDQFFARRAKQEARRTAIANWHLKAHVEGGLPLPWNPEENYIDCNVYDPDSYNVNPEKSLDLLAQIAAFVSDQDGVTLEKNYGHSFSLEVRIPCGDENEALLHYSAEREAVCTKKVVGTKVVPERVTPAYEEEIVEWDCEPVSLLARNKAQRGVHAVNRD